MKNITKIIKNDIDIVINIGHNDQTNSLNKQADLAQTKV